MIPVLPKTPRIWVALLLLLSWAGGARSACTETELESWYERDGKTLKPGASIWAGADGIPLYNQEGGVQTVESLKMNEPAMAIERIVRSGEHAWIEVKRGTSRVWLRADEAGLVCRSTPLKDEHGQLLQKVVVRIENRQGREAQVRLHRQPGEQMDAQDLGIKIFDFFFVYARQGEWHLLARGEDLSPFGGEHFLGWARNQDLIRWDTREVAATREGSQFLPEAGAGAPLAHTTGTWGPEVRRPPILAKAQGPDTKTYLKVALPADLDANRKHSENLVRLAEAEAAWKSPLVVFLVDGTESTLPYLEQIHGTLDGLLRKLDEMGQGRGARFRYALYSYTDKAYGERWRARRYQGATDSTFALRQAFEALREDTKVIARQRDASDDFPEDLFAGLRRVLDQELVPEAIESSMPVLILLGDHGSRPEDAELQGKERQALDALIPFFVQMGYPTAGEAADSRLRQSADAYERFREDARSILGKGRYKEGSTFLQGGAPDTTAEAVRKALEDVIARQEKAGRVADTVALGGTWDQAVKAANWPLAYSQAFRSLLLAKGYDAQVLDEGAFIAVADAWVAETDVTTEAFITKQELYEWIVLFKRMANPENWEVDKVKEIFSGSVGAYTGEELLDRPLEEVLTARAGIPVQNTRLLAISAGDLAGLDRDEVRYYAHLFQTFQEALEALGRGELPEFEPAGYGDGPTTRDSIRIAGTRPATLWFPYAAGMEAAYIPLENLP